MLQAAQIVDSFHVVQLLMRATDPVRCAERRESAAAAPERLCSWMMHSAVAEMKSVARTLRKEREGILNW